MSSQVEYQETIRRKKQQWLYDKKAERGCVDCGETDPLVLDFDHLDPATKTKNAKGSRVADGPKRLMWTKLSYAQLEAEVAKCEVVCANCHRRRTARMQGWYAWQEVS